LPCGGGKSRVRLAGVVSFLGWKFLLDRVLYLCCGRLMGGRAGLERFLRLSAKSLLISARTDTRLRLHATHWLPAFLLAMMSGGAGPSNLRSLAAVRAYAGGAGGCVSLCAYLAAVVCPWAASPSLLEGGESGGPASGAQAPSQCEGAERERG